MNKRALLIGYGSVGRKHLENLEKNGFKVDICETNKKKQKELKKKNYIVYGDLPKFKKLYYQVATIASWGPDHYKHFLYCANILKVKYIVLEKPMCASELQIKKILDIVKRKNIKFVVHHRRKFNNIQDSISKIFFRFKDKPIFAQVHGGSTCSITTGIHFLSLVCEIFKEIPKSVFSDIKDDKINPRHKNLGYWSGTSIFYFSKKKYLSISNTNRSPIKNTLILYGKKLRVDLEGNKIFFGKIGKKLKKVTNHQLVERNFLNNKINNNHYKLMLNRLRNISVKEMEFNAQVMKAILRSLISSKYKKNISMSLKLGKILERKKWPVS